MACCRSAGYKAVPISKDIQSSDVFSPDSPVRVTQRNVGQYFVPETSPQGKSHRISFFGLRNCLITYHEFTVTGWAPVIGEATVISAAPPLPW